MSSFPARDGSATSGLQVEVEQTLPMRLSGAFQCAPAELLALVGPSGAGKTSLLRVMAGLMRPERGRVALGDMVWCDTERGVFLPPQQRHVGLVFQDYALMPHLSALGNVELALLDLPSGARRAEAQRWLEHLRLDGELHRRRPAELSGGQRQRVAVARALARQPRLLLLDEPFSAVDAMNRQQIYSLLADLRQTISVPIVLVTHDLGEARLLADRLVVLDDGVVLQQGTPEAIHRKPRNARVADLVGLQNRFNGRWLGPETGSPGGTELGRLAWGPEVVLRVRDKGRIDADQPVTWVIPADGITVFEGAPSAADEFEVVVSELRHLGEITLATLSLTALDDVRLRIVRSGPQQPRLVEGARLGVRLDLAKVHVMPLRTRRA